MTTASLTRRSVLAAAAAVSGAAAAVPCVAKAALIAAEPRTFVAGGPGAWERALQSWTAARNRHETFLVEVLDPAVRAAASRGAGLTPAIVHLEEQGDDLCHARHDALRDLIAVPACNPEALRLKFRLAYEEVLRFDDHTGFVCAILADCDRLASRIA